MKPILVVSMLVASLLSLTYAQTPHCGTALWFRSSRGPAAMASRWAAKRAAPSEAYRTLETPHFRIQYSLAGLNRIKTTEADTTLLRLVDSLNRISPGHGGGSADPAFVDAKLDGMGAPHPQYAMVMSGYLENARAYYVDKLGMHAPRSVGYSYYYQAPAGGDGKYSVDIVDVGTAEPDFHGQEIYALTFPAAEGGMLMDNDFLFSTRLDPASGIPEGDTIQSRYQGALIHNYAIDWQAGLKVTCFHEFYHAVQFTYTPNPLEFHVWYETGAVGMEERNAPEVNDYLQYLPAYFQDLPDVGMFNYPGRLSWYGNGIFHLFLNHELGEDFDVAVWSRLAANGNDIRDALAKVGNPQGKSLKQIYADFAAQLAFNGKPVRPPFQPYSPDMPLWPPLQTQSLDIGPITGYQTAAQAPLTISALRIAGSAGGAKSVVGLDTGMVPVLAFSDPDSNAILASSGQSARLDFRDAPGRDNLLLLANGSLSNSASAQILILSSIASDSLFAYPNPLRISGPVARLFFSRLARDSEIRIYGEAGREIRALTFTPDSSLWSWDLKDAAGAQAKPGVYYFRASGKPVAPFLLY